MEKLTKALGNPFFASINRMYSNMISWESLTPTYTQMEVHKVEKFYREAFEIACSYFYNEEEYRTEEFALRYLHHQILIIYNNY